jgi:cutinase
VRSTNRGATSVFANRIDHRNEFLMSTTAGAHLPTLQTLRRIGAVAVMAVTMMTGPQALQPAGADACPNIDVVFARGTLEPPGVGATGQAFVDALNDHLAGRNIGVDPVDYPASLDFQTAAAGVADAANRVTSVATNCPNTRIVLGGYSQGAAVAAYTTTDTIPDGYPLPDGITGPLPAATAAHVAAVALFGKPSSGFLDLVDRNAPPIVIGHNYAGKTIELCSPGDPVCDPGGRDRAAHSSYKSNGMADQAAEFVVNEVTPRD